jgi:hypothetical protein
MDGAPTPEEIEQFEAIDTENRIVTEEWDREIEAAKGGQTLSQIDPLASCDPRDGRLFDCEKDARLKHGALYDRMIDAYIIPLINQKPELFKILRNTVNGAEVAFQCARAIQNPQLLERPEFRGFEDYLRYVAELKTGKFDNYNSPADFERALDDFKENSEDGETIDEFFNKKLR